MQINSGTPNDREFVSSIPREKKGNGGFEEKETFFGVEKDESRGGLLAEKWGGRERSVNQIERVENPLYGPKGTVPRASRKKKDEDERRSEEKGWPGIRDEPQVSMGRLDQSPGKAPPKYTVTKKGAPGGENSGLIRKFFQPGENGGTGDQGGCREQGKFYGLANKEVDRGGEGRFTAKAPFYGGGGKSVQKNTSLGCEGKRDSSGEGRAESKTLLTRGGVAWEIKQQGEQHTWKSFSR